MKKLGKNLEALGISRARALQLFKAGIQSGRAKLDVSGRSLPEFLGALERLDEPVGDGERVTFVARPTAVPTGRGFVHEVVAVGRSHYGALAEVVIGRTDADEMIVVDEVKP